MPFRSRAQARWMFAKHPAMARRWAHETPSITDLPQKLAGGGAPRTLVELLKSLPRDRRFDVLRENRMRDVSDDDAMFRTLKSEASPLALAGPFPDFKVKGNLAMMPRSRQRFLMYDSTIPNKEGHATELGSLAANWKGPWEPQDLIDLDIAKPYQRQGYGRETMANILSTVPNEGQKFPLYDVKRSAKNYWESLGAQMKDPSAPFRQLEKRVYDRGMYDPERSLLRNNDYSITPGDYLDRLDRFAAGGRVRDHRLPIGRYAAGGPVGVLSGHEPDTASTGDPRLDPRTRAIQAINERVAQSTSLAGAQRATMDITAPFRGTRRLLLPHLSNPWAAQYLASTPLDTQLGYGRGPLPDRLYAEGGAVEDKNFLERHPWLVGGAGAAAAAARPGVVNGLARPFMRAMARPHLGVESVSKLPLSLTESDARFNIAREASGHPLASRPVSRLQGAWQGEDRMEFNPLYVQPMPRTLGRVADDRQTMGYASQMGENLEQQATPVARFVPHAWNTDEGANALEVSDIGRSRLRSLASLLGPNVVTAHRPGRKALVFPLDETKLRDIATDINASFSFPKIRYGRSDPGVDRVLLSRQPLGYEDALYSQHGARPRSEAYEALERAALKKPESWNDLGLGAK